MSRKRQVVLASSESVKPEACWKVVLSPLPKREIEQAGAGSADLSRVQFALFPGMGLGESGEIPDCTVDRYSTVSTE